MQDLVVCVGESCHLSGAEIVVKRFMELIDENKLADRIALKGSFCSGECCAKCPDEISVRWNSQVFQVTPDTAQLAFTRDICTTFSTGED